MSATLQSSEATLDLVIAIEEALDGKGERKWRAKETLSINKARRDETKRKQEEKAMEEQAKEKAAVKAAYKEQAAARPALEIRFGLVSANTSSTVMAPPDLKIITKGAEVELFLHRDILTAQSEHFKSVLSAGGKVGGISEIKMKGEEPLIVLLLVRFCYTRRYDVGAVFDARVLERGPKVMGNVDPLLIHARVFTASKIYGMSNLTELAFEALQAELSSKLCETWDAGTLAYRNVAKRLILVMRHSKTGKNPLDPQLRDYIIGVWKTDDCKLACCYTKEEHFYELLLALPEIMDEIVCLSSVHEARYEMLRKVKRNVWKHGLDEDVVAFFRPLRLHTPMD